VALTILGLWFILAFKSSPAPRQTAVSVTSSDSTPTPTTDVPTTQPPAGPPPPPPSPTAATSSGGATRTVNGDVVSTRYGDVQVAVVLSSGRIVDVKALQLPFDRSRSQYISDQAAPLLHDEVLSAQSAQIDTIGGATYTSDAYSRSLQSALDRARA
jgi:uncharacterized protein with FMN-binding domain